MARHLRFGWFLLALVAFALGCSERAKKQRAAAPEAAVRPVSRPNTTPPRPREAARVRLGPGCACPAAPTDAGAAGPLARKALVTRIDGLNAGLSTLMKSVGKASEGKTPAQLTAPAPLVSLRAQQVCRLDCLLAQFPDTTAPLWRYLEAVGRYLDDVARGIARLATEPAKRKTEPSLTRLAARYNAIARASNHALGLELIAGQPPARQVGLDDSSFRKKVQRWRKAVAPELEEFTRQWMPLVKADKPLGPALERVVRLRVALARLSARLRHRLHAYRALVCAKGKRCATRGAQWAAAGKALQTLQRACIATIARLRQTSKSPLTVQSGRQLSRALGKPLTAATAAVAKLRW